MKPLKIPDSPDDVSKELWGHIRSDRATRLTLAKQSFYWFAHIYFSEYITHSTAPFQKEIYQLLHDNPRELLAFVAFRGSGKSSIVTTFYPLWSIIGVTEKRFILIISRTQPQARTHLASLKREIEGNELLRADFGALEENSDTWGQSALFVPRFNAQVIAASTEQSIRGLRHGSRRPDLLIVDDVEDLDSVKTIEGRNKVFNWLASEVLPGGDLYTQKIIIGNLLHSDSLLMRVKERMENNTIDGIFRSYPLVRGGKSLWPGKYPTDADIAKVKRSIGDELAFEREYMLRIVPEHGQLITPAMIHYYDHLPTEEPRRIGMGVDLAISERQSADCTAMVTAQVHGYGVDMKIYIHRNPINDRLSSLLTLTKARHQFAKARSSGMYLKIYVENVGYQFSMVQHLQAEGIDAEGVPVGSLDKHGRLALISYMFENGKVLFPKEGCEVLIMQLTGFGKEKHDDLVDATTIVVTKLVEFASKAEPRVRWI
jgi:predicted phage terminase large subunit-like protein